ncbi:hotdog fold thioesterase [Zoogloea sp.]|uniref:hotdog fold thioesterase n=1 Tax=Zoogloea sp. TaxID=49181 RepID=UPI001416036D|nr:MAG: hotdog fold thioesterase [Zoogloea sp.]
MSIWFAPFTLDEVNARGATCANGHLGMELIEIGEDFLRGRMPVDQRTRQPAGALHGGVSVAFAETLASWSAAHVVDPAKYHCVGQEINANHVRAVTGGWVYGEARPLHLGRTTQVWEIRITNEEGKLVCISRMTAAVLSKPSEYK